MLELGFLQIINHVNTKHTATKESLRTRTERGTHVEKENGKIPQMEYDYGKIRWREYQIENSDALQGSLICTRCGYENYTKGGITQHISAKHNELGKAYGLLCQYCAGIFSTLKELNRHIYDKVCPHKEWTIETKSWPDVWKDMCRKNNNIYRE